MWPLGRFVIHLDLRDVNASARARVSVYRHRVSDAICVDCAFRSSDADVYRHVIVYWRNVYWRNLSHAIRTDMRFHHYGVLRIGATRDEQVGDRGRARWEEEEEGAFPLPGFGKVHTCTHTRTHACTYARELSFFG